MLKFGWMRKNPRLVLGLLLLAPFALFAMVGIIAAFVPYHPSADVLCAPCRLHPFGTDADGSGLAAQVIDGARHTYFAALIAALLALGLGLWLGHLTSRIGPDSVIMGAVQILETIPILLALLVGLSVLGWWEGVWKSRLVESLSGVLRVSLVGVMIGLGLLPRVIRQVRERIQTFACENFVDATKAHGVSQKKILWFHIIWRNCIGDLVVTFMEIWAMAIFIEVSLGYLISISTIMGAKAYQSWAAMLVDDHARNAIVNHLCIWDFQYWWLYTFPALFISSTIVGFLLLGDGIRELWQEDYAVDQRAIIGFDGSPAGSSAKEA